MEASQSIVSRALESLSSVKHVDLPPDNIAHLQLIDEYQSATIEGARTTIDNVRKGVGDKKSNTMVKQSFAGLQYLLNRKDFTEESIIEAWKIITKDCCENIGAGVDGYRTGMVYVSSSDRMIHIPAKPVQIPGMMKDMLQYNSGSELLDAVLYSFYIVYVHPFADGNGRLSRIVLQKLLNIPGFPLSKAISLHLREYYNTLSSSEAVLNGCMDISPYINYMLSVVIPAACNMYKLCSVPLSKEESKLITKMDKTGRGQISIEKIAQILDVDSFDAVKAANSLVDKGYFEYNRRDCTYTLIWR